MHNMLLVSNEDPVRDIHICYSIAAFLHVRTLPQNASRRDCNGKCIEMIEGHYLEVVVLLYMKGPFIYTQGRFWL